MSESLDEHTRTMMFADIAMGQIKSLKQPASPRNYEIWYAYAAGHNPAVNKAINTTLATTGKLTDNELSSIYENHLARGPSREHLDTIGGQVSNEIDDLMQIITEALGHTATYGTHLHGAIGKIAEAKDGESILPVLEALVRITRDVESNNKALEHHLAASREEISALKSNLETISTESRTDSLTGLGNRKYLDRSLAQAVASAQEGGEPLSLLMLDIDHFKSFNDNYGHPTGDQILRLVAHALKENVKGQDIIGRYGGEEFAVVLPNTALRQAVGVADHIRRVVMAKELKKKSTSEILGRVTLSAGVAMLRTGDDADTLLDRADGCLYAAKRNGRNRVICEIDPEYTPNIAIRAT